MRASKTYLPVGIFGLQPLSLDYVDPHQTVFDAIWGKFFKMSGGSWSWRVIWQWVDLKHTLIQTQKKLKQNVTYQSDRVDVKKSIIKIQCNQL